MKKILFTKAFAVIRRQLVRQRRDNFLTVFSAFVFQNFVIDALAYMPVHQNERGINGLRDLETGELFLTDERWLIEGKR